jgi:hypothetical protein
MKLQTCADLDPLRCSHPGCTETHPLPLHSACHPGKGLAAEYDSTTGALRVSCYTCGKFVVLIAVQREVH